MAAAGLAGSSAAIPLPVSPHTSEIAAILAVGALALLAGHQWGLVVVVAADIVLLGRVWPLLVYDWPPSLATQVATYTAVVGALPGLFLLKRTLPRTVDLIVGAHPPPLLRNAGIFCGVLLSAWSLVLPVF